MPKNDEIKEITDLYDLMVKMLEAATHNEPTKDTDVIFDAVNEVEIFKTKPYQDLKCSDGLVYKVFSIGRVSVELDGIPVLYDFIPTLSVQVRDEKDLLVEGYDYVPFKMPEEDALDFCFEPFLEELNSFAK